MLERGRSTLLVVDDDALIRWSLRERLQGGFRVVEADGVRTAREALRAGAGPTVAIVDIALRDGDGFEVLHDVRAMAPGSKVVVLTALASEEARALASGADAFVSKPFHMSELLTRIRTLAGLPGSTL